MDDDPFAGVVLTFSPHVRKHGEVCGGVDQPEQNPLGRVRVAGEQVINDGGPVCQGFIGPFNPHVVPRVAGRRSQPERGPDQLSELPEPVRPGRPVSCYGGPCGLRLFWLLVRRTGPS